MVAFSFSLEKQQVFCKGRHLGLLLLGFTQKTANGAIMSSKLDSSITTAAAEEIDDMKRLDMGRLESRKGVFDYCQLV